MKKLLTTILTLVALNTGAQTIHYEGEYAIAAIQPLCDNYDSRVKIHPVLSTSNGIPSAFVNWWTEIKLSQVDTAKWIPIDFGGFSSSLPDTIIIHQIVIKAFWHISDSAGLTNISYK